MVAAAKISSGHDSVRESVSSGYCPGCRLWPNVTCGRSRAGMALGAMIIFLFLREADFSIWEVEPPGEI